MQYFSRFPVIGFTLDATGKNCIIPATDITRRFKLSDLAKNGSLVFFQYSLKEGERPDIVAYKYYGDSTLDWLVLMANEILDPYFQWPMSTLSLEAYIRQKYGSVSVAMGQVHHYEWIKQAAVTFTSTSGEIVQIPETFFVVDRATYLTLSSGSRRQLTAYDYEVALNEKRRDISLIDQRYVAGLQDNYGDLFR